MMRYSIPQIAIFVVLACAVVGIAMVAVRQTGVQIPPWVITIAWIVVVAIVAIASIKFLVSMV